jgi:hypothetical protein
VSAHFEESGARVSSRGSNVRVRELLKLEHLTVTSLEAVILLDGDHHRALATVAGDRHRPHKGVQIIHDLAWKRGSRTF